MIYITGDTHGDISCFKNPKLNKLGEKDILIVCGDFGFIWNPHDKNEKKNLFAIIFSKRQTFLRIRSALYKNKVLDFVFFPVCTIFASN